MPRVVLHKNGQTVSGDVASGANLVVCAGIRRFPFPHLSYGCGMGKCGKCACRILRGAESLPEPNWKEKRVLKGRIGEGYRLVCQLWLEHDIELAQESPAVGLAGGRQGNGGVLQCTSS